jgi:DNA-binding MarR family transcriptional regulator
LIPLEVSYITKRNRNSSGGLRKVEAMATNLTAAQALRLWHDVSLAAVRDDEPDLSLRQMSLLLTIYLEAPPHTVRDLARKLGVSKPVVTRALDTMGKLGLLSRRRDEKDRRNVLVQRTVRGALYLERFADTVGALSRGI